MDSLESPVPTRNVIATTTKTLIVQAIKKADLPQLQKLFELYKFDPTEDFSPNSTQWNCLHYACCFDSVVILDYLLKIIYQLHGEDYPKFVNSKTVEGWTPLMMTAIYDKSESFNLLIKYGGIRLYDTDNKGMKAADLALKYKREHFFKTLTKLMRLYPFKEGAPNEITLDTISLSQGAGTETQQDGNNFEDKEEYKELLLNGHRMPCQICRNNKGWLKYTLCCGEPVHSLCVNKKMKCPFCGEAHLSLSTNLKYPEKGLTLNKE